MATTVHIPDDLLRAVDERAKRLKLTRNRFVIEALKKALAERDTAWSEDFVRQLGAQADVDAIDDMLSAIKKQRSSKGAPKL